MKVLSFGSLNVDYVYSVEHIAAPGETIFSPERKIYPGGKGLNQSVALARAGCQVWHAGFVGAGGEILRQTLLENGIETELLAASDAPTGHTVIQVSRQGQNAIVLYGGTNRMLTMDYAASVLSHFQAGDLLLLQNETNLLPEIIQQAWARGMYIALNPSPFDEGVTACDLDKVNLFLVNEIEGAQIAGLPAAGSVSEAQTDRILSWFEHRFPAAEVILTLGSQGAWYAAAGTRIFQPAIPCAAVDTTVAGDTFTGYYLAGRVRGDDISAALADAAKAASIAVTRRGAVPSIPRRDEL